MFYTSNDIKVLKGLEAVQKRPGMYIGNTEDGTGLHRMVFEILDNSVDEHVAGYCDVITVTLENEKNITIEDNGRGIPFDNYRKTNKTTAEIIMTTLHSGGKFNSEIYHYSSGLHGVGLSVVNALSKKLNLEILQKKYKCLQTYEYGKLLKSTIIECSNNKTGTKISFFPNEKILLNCAFSIAIIEQRLSELSFLNEKLTLNLIHKKVTKTFYNSGGLTNYINTLCEKTQKIGSTLKIIKKINDDVEIDIMAQWTTRIGENIICYTNNTKQNDGGSHLIGFKNSLMKTFLDILNSTKPYKNFTKQLSWYDIKEGLTAIVSIKMKNPKFSSQLKEKLISTEIKSILELVCKNEINLFFIRNKETQKILIDKIIHSIKLRLEIKKIKENKKKIINYGNIRLPGKLADCQEQNPKKAELFLVEGDSAGGSAKQARNRQFQAVLPLKGKIINAEKTTVERLLENVEIQSILNAIGLTNFKEQESTLTNNLRYHKIIIMTDADVDGAHITALLLTLFYKKIPSLIKNGNLYITQPPLYKIKINNKIIYTKTKNELIELLYNNFFKDIKFFSYTTNEKLNTINIKNVYLNYLQIKEKLKKYNTIIKENIILNTLLKINKKYIINFNWIEFVKKLKFLINKKNSYDNYLIKNNLENGTLENEIKKINNQNIIKEIIIPFKKKIIKNKLNKQFYIKKNKIKKKFTSFCASIKWVLTCIENTQQIQRFKGLGEMSPKQLEYTAMNPKTRQIKKIIIENEIATTILFKTLMGIDSTERKSYIYDKNIIDYYGNVDV